MRHSHMWNQSAGQDWPLTMQTKPGSHLGEIPGVSATPRPRRLTAVSRRGRQKSPSPELVAARSQGRPSPCSKTATAASPQFPALSGHRHHTLSKNCTCGNSTIFLQYAKRLTCTRLDQTSRPRSTEERHIPSHTGLRQHQTCRPLRFDKSSHTERGNLGSNSLFVCLFVVYLLIVEC